VCHDRFAQTLSLKCRVDGHIDYLISGSAVADDSAYSNGYTLLYYSHPNSVLGKLIAAAAKRLGLSPALILNLQ
jgi:hypothetical protein